MVGYLLAGKKGGFTFLPHINTHSIPTDMLATTCVLMRNEEHQHGKFHKAEPTDIMFTLITRLLFIYFESTLITYLR
jgi:hypothetical protein